MIQNLVNYDGFDVAFGAFLALISALGGLSGVILYFLNRRVATATAKSLADKAEAETKEIEARAKQIEFEIDANKNISKTWLINYGVKTAFEKIK